MLTAAGCQARRERLLRELNPPPDLDRLVLADPVHLAYLANFWVDPISLSAGFPAYLMLRRDGHTKLLCDNRQAGAAASAHVDEVREVAWYDGQSPGRGPRQLALLSDANPTRHGLAIHDRPGDPYASTLIRTLAMLRRRKDPDELAVLRQSMRAIDAGHAWAKAHIAPGMTELDVFSGVSGACVRAAGTPVVVYGDFAVSPGPERRGGPPTPRTLREGDMFILDFSAVVRGYRGDFTTTLCVGRSRNPAQDRIFTLCQAAMAAGEQELRAGNACKTVFDAMLETFARAGMAEHFPHHGGHGLGLTHPEAPFIVRHADEDLWAGDVVTLEPGLYVPGIGGVRIERNYLIADGGYERLCNHEIA